MIDECRVLEALAPRIYPECTPHLTKDAESRPGRQEISELRSQPDVVKAKRNISALVSVASFWNV